MLLFPASNTGKLDSAGGPIQKPRERLVFPLLDVLRRLGIRFSPAGASAKVTHRLDIAGNASGWSVERFFAAKGLLLLVLGLVGLVVGGGPLSLVGFLVAIGFGAAGFLLPDALLYHAGIKRQAEIRKSLSDVVDLLSVSMKAGLGFDAAVGRVAQIGRGPLAAEFGRYLQELRLGKSRGEALRAMAERSTVVDLHHIISSLVQADSLGIPVAKVLDQQAKEVRVKRRQRAEEKAQKLALKLVFPTVVCIFPALFIAVIGPGIIRLIQALFGHGGAFS